MNGISSWCLLATSALSTALLFTRLVCTYYRPELTKLCESGALRHVMSLRSKRPLFSFIYLKKIMFVPGIIVVIL